MDSESKGSPVSATYREIADHFGLSGPDAGRTKAKRARWPVEPINHPADTRRVRVPFEAWHESEGSKPERPRSIKLKAAPIPPPQNDLSPTLKVLEGALKTLQERLERGDAERDQLRADLERDRTASAAERDRLQDKLDQALAASAADRAAWNAERDRLLARPNLVARVLAAIRGP